MRLVLSRVILNDWETLSRLLSDHDWGMDGELLLAEPWPGHMCRKCPGPDFGVDWKWKRESRGQSPSIPLAHAFGRSYKSGKRKINGNYWNFFGNYILD